MRSATSSPEETGSQGTIRPAIFATRSFAAGGRNASRNQGEESTNPSTSRPCARPHEAAMSAPWLCAARKSLPAMPSPRSFATNAERSGDVVAERVHVPAPAVGLTVAAEVQERHLEAGADERGGEPGVAAGVVAAAVQQGDRRAWRSRACSAASKGGGGRTR